MTAKSLCLVEDEISPIRPLVRALADDNLHCTHVRTIRAFVDRVAALDQPPFDGFIIDLNLPIHDAHPDLADHIRALGDFPYNSGQALARWLRRRDAQTKILYLTNAGHCFNKDYEEGHAGKPSVVLLKPSDEASPLHIATTVRRAFEW